MLWDRGGTVSSASHVENLWQALKGHLTPGHRSGCLLWVLGGRKNSKGWCFKGGWCCLHFIHFAPSDCCLGRNGFELLIVYFVFIRAQTCPVLSHSPTPLAPFLLQSSLYCFLLSLFPFIFHPDNKQSGAESREQKRLWFPPHPIRIPIKLLNGIQILAVWYRVCL